MRAESLSFETYAFIHERATGKRLGHSYNVRSGLTEVSTGFGFVLLTTRRLAENGKRAGTQNTLFHFMFQRFPLVSIPSPPEEIVPLRKLRVSNPTAVSKPFAVSQRINCEATATATKTV